MYSGYFRQRLMEALVSAEQAETEQERQVHLRTSCLYLELLEVSTRRQGSDGS
jgi:hypothetical protein